MTIMKMFGNTVAKSQVRIALTKYRVELDDMTQEEATGKIHVQASTYGESKSFSESMLYKIKKEIQKICGVNDDVVLNINHMPRRGVIIDQSW